MDAENLSDKEKTLTLAFVVTSSEGVWLDTVYADPASMGAGEKQTIAETWVPDEIVTDELKIQAVGALDGMPMNPIDATLYIFSPEDLLQKLIDHILDRATLQPDVRNIVDLNGNNRLDAADVVSFIKNFK